MATRRLLVVLMSVVALAVVLVLLYWFAFTPFSVETGSSSGSALGRYVEIRSA